MTALYNIAALYCILPLEKDELVNMKSQIEAIAISNQLLGALIIAPEGINGTIASKEEVNLIRTINAIKSLSIFINQEFEIKYSTSHDVPFNRMRVLLKKELLPLGITVNTNLKGEYVDSYMWDELVSDDNVIKIDVRNDYEIEIGKFHNAINPSMKTMKDFAKFANNLKQQTTNNNDDDDDNNDPTIAMYCTGGIRCEIASAYMKQIGFNQVKMLKGGILKYLEEHSEGESFEGECFVFDKRVSVTKNLKNGNYKMCYRCRHTLNLNDQASPDYKPNICCSYCIHADTGVFRDITATLERDKQIELCKERGENHLRRDAFNTKA